MPKKPGTSLEYFFSLLRWISILLAYGVVTSLICILSFFISREKLDHFVRKIPPVFLFLIGARVKVTGEEHLQKNKNYIFVFNHTNFFDHMVLYPIFTTSTLGLEKKDHFKIPFHGWMLKAIGQIPIPPKNNTQAAVLALEKAQQKFREGFSIAIAPEGTRTRDGKLLRFKKGAFHLSVDLQADIAPLILKNMFELNERNSFLIRPSTIEVIIEKPISTKGLDKKDIDTLKDQTYAIFKKHVE